MGMGGASGHTATPYINVTPLIDVLLVLLMPVLFVLLVLDRVYRTAPH